MLKLMRLEAQRINLRVYFLTALILGGILPVSYTHLDVYKRQTGI